MTKAEFVTAIKELYTDLREVGGSIILDGENRTRTGDDDPPGIKPSFQLAQELWDRVDTESRRTFVERLRSYVEDAEWCRKQQKNPLTRDPKNARCRPVITIDRLGSPICDWQR